MYRLIIEIGLKILGIKIVVAFQIALVYNQ